MLWKNSKIETRLWSWVLPWESTPFSMLLLFPTRVREGFQAFRVGGVWKWKYLKTRREMAKFLLFVITLSLKYCLSRLFSFLGNPFSPSAGPRSKKSLFCNSDTVECFSYQLWAVIRIIFLVHFKIVKYCLTFNIFKYCLIIFFLG